MSGQPYAMYYKAQFACLDQLIGFGFALEGQLAGLIECHQQTSLSSNIKHKLQFNGGIAIRHIQVLLVLGLKQNK